MFVLSWLLASNEIKKGLIYPRRFIHWYEGNIENNWDINMVLGIHLSGEYTEFTNYLISEGKIKCE